MTNPGIQDDWLKQDNIRRERERASFVIVCHEDILCVTKTKRHNLKPLTPYVLTGPDILPSYHPNYPEAFNRVLMLEEPSWGYNDNVVSSFYLNDNLLLVVSPEAIEMIGTPSYVWWFKVLNTADNKVGWLRLTNDEILDRVFVEKGNI